MTDLNVTLVELVHGPGRIEALLTVVVAGGEPVDIIVAAGDSLPGQAQVVAVEPAGVGQFADPSIAVSCRGVEMRLAVGGRLVRRGNLWCIERGRARTVTQATREAHEALRAQMAAAAPAGWAVV